MKSRTTSSSTLIVASLSCFCIGSCHLGHGFAFSTARAPVFHRLAVESIVRQRHCTLQHATGKEDVGELDDSLLLMKDSDADAVQKVTSEGSSSSSLIDANSAIVWLNIIAVLWGSQHSVIKLVLDHGTIPPGPLLLLRFGLAALLASPYTPPLTSDRQDTTGAATAWRWGLEMGFWMFLGFLLQAIGLQYTTAQKSGFLLYLNVKFVPFLASLLYQRTITGATWASAATAFAGTALLSGASTLNIGDAWSIAAALASALFIVRLERASQAVPNAAQLNSASLWAVTALAGVWSLVGSGDGLTTTVSLSSLMSTTNPSFLTDLVALFYLGAVTTAGANWIQTKAQGFVASERAAVVYALDPVYGAVFAYVLLGETLANTGAWIGAGLIVLAAGTNALWDVTTAKEEQ